MLMLDESGTPAGSATWFSNAVDAQQFAAIAARGEGAAFAVWNDGRASGGVELGSLELYGRLVPKTGALSAEAAVAWSVKEQRSPHVVAGPDGFLVLWTEESGINRRHAFASLIDDDGTIRKSNIPVASAAAIASSLHLIAAASGDGYLIAWWDDEGILATRLTIEGVVVDDPPIRFGPKGEAPAIASDGRDFLVTWSTREWNHGPIESTRASLIAYDGTVSSEAGNELSCCEAFGSAVAWNGSRYVSVWAETAFKYAANVRGRFISSSGIPMEPKFNISDQVPGPGISGFVQGDESTLVTFGFGQCQEFIGPAGPLGVAECGYPIRGSHAAWTGRAFLVGESPLAVRNERKGLLAATRAVRPLPGAHEGGVRRLFFSMFDVGRRRAVRR